MLGQPLSNAWHLHVSAVSASLLDDRMRFFTARMTERGRHTGRRQESRPCSSPSASFVGEVAAPFSGWFCSGRASNSSVPTPCVQALLLVCADPPSDLQAAAQALGALPASNARQLPQPPAHPLQAPPSRQRGPSRTRSVSTGGDSAARFRQLGSAPIIKQAKKTSL
jgi:hypothetical protein